ncbi:MAG: hypothetical protein U0670_11915 [Anaerolineae bacterium]
MANPTSQVVFCGENPELRLFREGTEEMVAIASYWQCSYSAYGQGQVLIVWTSPDGTGLGAQSRHAIYADNLPLAHFLAQTLVQYFDGFQTLEIGGLTPIPARLVRAIDPRRDYRVFCYSEHDTLELLWGQVLDTRLPGSYPNLFKRSDDEIQYDVHNVICPCGDARLWINGQAAAGQLVHFHDGTRHRSNAFLAYSETWVEHRPASPSSGS